MRISVALVAIFLIFLFCLVVTANAADGAITQDGGISASWVLVGAFTIIGALITFIIADMKKQFTNTMNAMIQNLKDHSGELKEHGESIVAIKTHLKL